MRRKKRCTLRVLLRLLRFHRLVELSGELLASSLAEGNFQGLAGIAAIRAGEALCRNCALAFRA